ncbi:ribosomal protein S5 domain 2-type protein [Piptocephalis cylindrospora]|uniref:Ribosomal RNA-processing protein 42 n=1 Tax=Piptocephalis cylindrospora TaxID=1907219 RepID=A0A4P9Y711_9FUNG|nr:ribosomal protein S5 domain 2-type protein [Piptocephalis cylindrospora]|eukprot:RKP14494.1 ribosomal protein S5 domain 2-type protein [Piptocephalis cylindrospora]
MPSSLLSPVERDFIRSSILSGTRSDGRGPSDYRTPELVTCLIPQTDGSARCRLGDGTDVLVSVKAEVGSVDLSSGGDTGRVVCNVEASPSANQSFEGRGADELNNELTRALDRAIAGPQGGLDLKALCIVPGAHCWDIHVDALILDDGGNLMDALFMAVRAALCTSRIPATTTQDVGEGQVEFEVVDDVDQAKAIAGSKDLPLCVTVHQIGEGHVVDATPTEALCSSAQIHVSFNGSGQLCALQKGGSGPIEPSVLMSMMQTGREQAKKLLSWVDGELVRQEKLDKEQRRLGQAPTSQALF